MLILAALALQVQIQVGPSSRRDRPSMVVDSATDSTQTNRRRAGRRLPVTEKALATAFKDAQARSLLAFARKARMEQDSALMSYDATAYQRISAGLGFSKIGRDRLIFRTESAIRVQWRRDVGAYVDLKGVRTVLPGIPQEGQDEAREDLADEDDMWPIPYYPGYEQLWIGSGMARSQVNEREIVHPIAEGAEAYYTYEAGDTVSFRLPDGKVFNLRELRVRPREPKWNVVVGSLWFDIRTGQLVRAAYRLAVPLDVWTMVKQEDPKSMNDIPKWVMPLISPINAQVTAIAVEYGLHQGRFWLPRVRAAEGSAQVSFMRVPFKMEQSFKYASVNALDSLPAIRLAGGERPRLDTLPDSLREKVRDSIRVAARARRDSIREGLIERPRHVSACDTGKVMMRTARNGDMGGMPVAYRIPCDVAALEHSPDLPPSIFDPGDELFDAKEREALIAEALSLTAQPNFSFRPVVPPTLKAGAEFFRYNRVEGFSFGGLASQQFGGGYTASALGRIGLADREPNVELTVERSNLSQAVRVAGYNHLVSANDWGNPLSFGSSLSAILWGRDEGFYYRSSGVEVGWRQERGARFDWRIFAEQERTAKQETNFSLAHATHGALFQPNIDAQRGTYIGSSMRLTHSHGLDPQGFRVFTDLRAEAAASDSAYGRAALDLTVTQGFGKLIAGALTLSGGSSIGALPAQRRWYLGGSQTIRGQAPDTSLSGNAFWMTRAELGAGLASARPVVFTDLGWVGSRDAMDKVGRPLSGVGVGSSFMDGLVRFDVARGIYPTKQWRVDMYVEAKF
jgi:hemolysin secretion/activation protein ShlB/FhaC/HecB